MLYQDVEFFSVMNNAITGKLYPQEKLNKGWETILLNQFHDILPGTSIKEVYEDSHKDYKKILKAGNEMLEQAVSGIASNVLLEEASIIVFNQLSFDRSDVVEVLLPDEYTM